MAHLDIADILEFLVPQVTPGTAGFQEQVDTPVTLESADIQATPESVDIAAIHLIQELVGTLEHLVILECLAQADILVTPELAGPQDIAAILDTVVFRGHQGTLVIPELVDTLVILESVDTLVIVELLALVAIAVIQAPAVYRDILGTAVIPVRRGHRVIVDILAYLELVVTQVILAIQAIQE